VRALGKRIGNGTHVAYNVLLDPIGPKNSKNDSGKLKVTSPEREDEKYPALKISISSDETLLEGEKL
jgi:hypothetical protein|tara:strand:- start:15402 stop:15602 length:201 start_codon:yes stop_codon:yes gene_type:complete